jgi:hypothetical protein
MRRIIVSLSSLFALAATLVTAAPGAFATRVTPMGGGSPVDAAPAVHHSGGLAPWQIVLIAIASVVIVAAALVVARLARTAHRPAPSRATI